MDDGRSESGSIAADRAPKGSKASGQLGRLLIRSGAGRIRSGSLLLDEAGRKRRYGTGEPVVHVRIHDVHAYAAVLKHGSVGLGQSYIDGFWDCEDLTALVSVLARNRSLPGRVRDQTGRFTGAVGNPVRRLRRGSKADDRRDIRAHYDIGNDFFALMLDPTMTYSCAIFDRPEATLEEASVAKLDRICQKLALSPSDHVLEIGSGWGGLAVHAANEYGCRVTTTTISAEQHAYATKRVAGAGLTDRVTVLHDDYRDLRGRFDKLVSIEMIEAVDWRQLDRFFRICAKLLRPEGLMALQAITIADQSYERAKNSTDFVKAFIFPGGCLPSISALARSTAATDMRIVDLEDIGRHYGETLRRWRANVDARVSEIEGLGLGQRFLRMWRFYLSYCEAAFLERHVSDVQMVLAKPAWRPPLLLRS